MIDAIEKYGRLPATVVNVLDFGASGDRNE